MIAAVGTRPGQTGPGSKQRVLETRLRHLEQGKNAEAADHEDRSSGDLLNSETSRGKTLAAETAMIQKALHRANVALIALELEDLQDDSTTKYGQEVAGTLSLALSDDQRSELNDHIVCLSQSPTRYQRLSVTGVRPLQEDELFRNTELRLEARATGRMLIAALEKQISSESLSTAEDTLKLSLALSSVARRMSKREAGEACLRAASLLTRRLERVLREDASGTHWDLLRLPRGLSCLARWMTPAEASKLSRPAQFLAHILAEDKTEAGMTSSSTMVWTSGLAAVAIWQEPAEAAALFERPLEKTRDPCLAWGLSRVSRRMEPAEAVRHLTLTLDRQWPRRGKDGWKVDNGDWKYLVGTLVTIARRATPDNSADARDR